VSTGWIAEARRPVSAVAAALGWEGTDKRGYPCPACREEKRDGRRGAVFVGRAGGWTCYRCNAIGGDGLDYLSFALTGARLAESTDRARIRAFVSGAGWTVALPPSAPPPRPEPPVDLPEFWRTCRPVPRDAFTTARGFASCPPDLARYTPEPPAPAPAWWPAGRLKTWRLVTRGYDASGRAVNLHGRAVVPPPMFRDPKTGKDKAGPKTLWAKSYCECAERHANLDDCPAAHEMPSEGVVFWNRVHPDDTELTLIAEGMTDWLSLALLVGDRRIAVYGVTSGGPSAFADIPLRGAVVLATDEDGAGDRYAAELLEHLGHLRVLRARLSGLASHLSTAQAAK
jgi:hypothetical protein